MRSFFVSYGDFIDRGQFTVNNVGVTNDGEYFTFPASSTNHLMSVRLNYESCYDDVTFRFKIRLEDVLSSSRVGILLKSATDNFDGEKSMFTIGDGKVSFYYGNTKQIDFSDFDITTLDNRSFILEMRRWNDYYYFSFLGRNFTRRLKGDGSFHRQNINACVFGDDVKIKIENVVYFTDKLSSKFSIVGDSIAQGYSSGGGGWEDTIKGINLLEKGLDFVEFAGSANVIKDSLDSFNDIAIVKPKYLIVMYGHNDILFNTGTLEEDYQSLIQRIKNYGIIPIVCAIPFSNWVDVTPANDFVTDKYFGEELHIDLYSTLTYPTDYNDIAHPNVQGNRKLANAIYDYIKDLP